MEDYLLQIINSTFIDRMLFCPKLPVLIFKQQKNWNFLKNIDESGNLKTIIERKYPPDNMVEAHQYVETGQKKGSVEVFCKN